MKEAFIRVGMMVPLTDEEIEQIKNDKMDNDVMLSIIRDRSRIEGYSYIPGECLLDDDSNVYGFHLWEEKKDELQDVECASY